MYLPYSDAFTDFASLTRLENIIIVTPVLTLTYFDAFFVYIT